MFSNISQFSEGTEPAVRRCVHTVLNKRKSVCSHGSFRHVCWISASNLFHNVSDLLRVVKSYSCLTHLWKRTQALNVLGCHSIKISKISVTTSVWSKKTVGISLMTCKASSLSSCCSGSDHHLFLTSWMNHQSIDYPVRTV